MKVGTGGNLGLSRECHKKLFGSLFYTWWNCSLTFSVTGHQVARVAKLVHIYLTSGMNDSV